MDINCEHASQLISRALDGEISTGDEEILRNHLAQCSSCKKAEKEYRRLSERLASALPPRQPLGYSRDLRERVRTEVSASPQPRTRLSFRVTSLAAIILLTLAVGLLSHGLRHARQTATRLKAAHEALLKARSGAPPLITAVVRHSSAIQRNIDEQVQAFQAVREYLGGAMRWMAVDGDQVEIGMSALPPSAQVQGPSSNSMLVLRFIYIERQRNGVSKVLSNPQFALTPGEAVAVRLRRTDGPVDDLFRYRVKADLLRGARIRVSVVFTRERPRATDLAFDSEPTITANVHLAEGEPVLLGASGDASRRHELYLWGVSRAIAPAEGTVSPSGRSRL